MRKKIGKKVIGYILSAAMVLSMFGSNGVALNANAAELDSNKNGIQIEQNVDEASETTDSTLETGETVVTDDTDTADFSGETTVNGTVDVTDVGEKSEANDKEIPDTDDTDNTDSEEKNNYEVSDWFDGDDAVIPDGETGAIVDGNFYTLTEEIELDDIVGVSEDGATGDILSGYADYKEYLSAHTITVDGKKITSGATIDPAKDFGLGLEFTFNMEAMADHGLKYYYVLPDYIAVPDKGSMAAQEILFMTQKNGEKTPIGTWFIKDNVLYVTYPGYYDQVKAVFSMGGSWEGTENLSEIEVNWGKDIDVFKIDLCELDIYKSTSGYKSDEEGNLISTFSVKIIPKKPGVGISNITFTDAFTVSYLELFDAYYPGGMEFKVTNYASDKSIVQEKYYDAAKVTTLSGKTYTTTIPGLSIDPDGYIIVEYAAKIPVNIRRTKIDPKNGNDSYTNIAKASYPFVNPQTGKTETLSAEVKLQRDYKSSGAWVYKEAGDDSKTKVVDGDTVRIVPYVVTINKHRYYSLGGSIAHDEITVFKGGDVVYDTSDTAKTEVQVVNKQGDNTYKQKWVVLDTAKYGDLYQQLLNFKSVSGKTQIEALRANKTLLNKLVAAINAETGSSLTAFDDEAALYYIFTDEKCTNFVWFSPLDKEPTTYTLRYDTLVPSTVGSFSNGASLWYTEIEGAPEGGGGVGWTNPIKKVLNSSKHNEGVYIGSDGNYYVDWTLTVGVPANSDGFDEVFIYDSTPYYKVKSSNSTTDLKNLNNINLFDWYTNVGPTDIRVDNSSKANYDAIENIFDISTESSDPRVLAVVDGAYAVFENEYRGNSDPVHTVGSWYGKGSGGDALTERLKFTDMSVLTEISNYGLTNVMSKNSYCYPYGQFYNTFDHSGNWIKPGNTFTPSHFSIFLGKLPATVEGYEIVVKYTSQVNPGIIQYLPEILELENKDFITLTNSMKVYTTYYPSGFSEEYLDARGGYISGASASYYLGIEDIKPGVNKEVKDYDDKSELINYTINVNPDNNIVASDATYEVTDSMNITGIKYKKDSFTIYDNKNRVIYSNAGKAVNAAYSGYNSLIKINLTESDNASNRFSIVFDNSEAKGSKFAGADGKLIQMRIEYSVEAAGIDTNLTVTNTAGLLENFYNGEGTRTYQNSLGTSDCEFAIDKAFDKHISQKPNVSNYYVATYYIDVNPKSQNADNLYKDKEFTIRDTLSNTLVLLNDSVVVNQILNGVKTDITKNCVLTYDRKSNQFEATIPIKNQDATYRIYYDAQVVADAYTLALTDNKAEILGKNIEPVDVEQKVMVYQYDSESAAYTSKINLVKYDTYNIADGISAEFDLYRYNKNESGTTVTWTQELLSTGEPGYEKIVTDSEGKATIQNKVLNSKPITYVKPGTWYKLVETKVDGEYIMDKEPIYYYVNDENGAPTKKDVPKGIDKYTVITLADLGASDEEIPTIYVGNERLGFNIKKVYSSNNKPAVGAEFSLYYDEACTQLIKTVADDSNYTENDGYISFTNLNIPVDATYYLKETKFPKGVIENDIVYTLVFENGVMKSCKAPGMSLGVDNTASKSTITISNVEDTGRLQISKKIDSKSITYDVNSFYFMVSLYDADGKILEGSFDATKSDGTEMTVKSGSMITLKKDQSIEIAGLPTGTKYVVTELTEGYVTTYNISDKNKGDTKSGVSGTQAQGKIEQSNIDAITFTNNAIRTLHIAKIAETDTGETLLLPDGFTIVVANGSNSKLFQARWDAFKEIFVEEYKSSSLIEMKNDITNGFTLTGLTTDEYKIYEDNYDIPGYACEKYYSITSPDKAKNLKEVTNYGITKYLTSEAEGNVTLVNKYTSKYTTAEINLSKQFNKELTNGAFNFEIFTTSETGYFSKYTVPIKTVTNDKEGKIKFELSYTGSDIGTHYYAVRESTEGTSSIKLKDGSSVLANSDNVVIDTTYLYYIVDVELAADGELVSKVTGPYKSLTDMEAAEAKFVNTYVAEGHIAFSGTKTAERYSVGANGLTFTVDEYDKTFKTVVNEAVATGKNTSSISKDGTGAITFTSINYDFEDVGEHYYIVTENVPQDATNGVKNGVKYDAVQHKVTVKVTDNGDGTLKAVATYEDGDKLEFVNAYSATGTVALKGTKILANQAITLNDFKFEVKEYDSSSRTKLKDGAKVYTAGVEAADLDMSTKKATADITFPDMQFTYNDTVNDLGYHYYKVTEVVPTNTDDGIKYSTASYNITINVTDNKDGTLKPTVVATSSGYTSSMTFTNTYSATGSLQFKGTKTLQGRELKAEEFNYVVDITEDDGLGNAKTTKDVQFGFNKADGTIVYPELSYTEASLGKTYTYVVKEVKPAESSAAYKKGVTYSEEKYTVTVKVLDAGKGKLEFETSVVDANNNVIKAAGKTGDVTLDFVNLYNAKNDITFTATKALAGREIEKDQFEFAIYEGTKVVATGKNDENGNVVFSKIEYEITSTKDSVVDTTGTHNYVIKEVIPTNKVGGYTYDTTSYPVTVVATDTGAGEITIAVTGATNKAGIGYVIDKTGDKADFNNEYSADAKLTLEGTKTLNGRDVNDGEFEFEAVEYKFENDDYKPTGNIYKGTNDADGHITFATITYQKNDKVDDLGNYKYVVTEVIPEDDDKLPGVTYDDTTSYNVTVAVTDNGDGTLGLSTSKNEKSLDFVNSYEAEIELTLTVSKTLDSKEIRDDQFEFGVLDATGAIISSATNDENGNVVFEPIHYYINGTDNNIGTMTYTVVEFDKSKEYPGYTFDDSEYNVVVEVTDNGNSTLNVEVKSGAEFVENEEAPVYKLVSADDEDIVFANIYEAEGSIQFEGLKTLVGLVTDNTREIIDGEFAFTVTEYTDDTYSEVKVNANDEPYEFTVNNDADGNILYEEIFYARNKDIDDVGTHYYIVKEEAGTAGGVTYSEEEIKIVIEVSDNDDGTLLVTPVDDTYKKVDFENYYEASGAITFEATKKAVDINGEAYDDKDLEGNSFESVFEFEIYEGETLVDSIELGVDETAKFKPIVYNLDDVGEHTYTICEKVGTEEGFEYSDEEYEVKILVSDNGDGTLLVEVDGDLPDFVIVNTYDAVGTLELKGIKNVANLDKMIKNNKLVAGEFTFEIIETTYDSAEDDMGDPDDDKPDDTTPAGDESGDKTPADDPDAENPDDETPGNDNGDDADDGDEEPGNDARNNLVSTGTIDEEGNIIFTPINYVWDDLGVHTYKITENQFSDVNNIVYDTKEILMTVEVVNNGDGTLGFNVSYKVEEEDVEGIEFTNASTSTSINKVDENGKKLKDATLVIKDSKGNDVVTFVTTDEVKVIYGLDKNVEYTLYESVSPKGYELANPIKFTINDAGEVIVDGKVVDEIVMVDKAIKVVKTGDTANIPVALLLLISSAFMIGVLYRRRREEEIL